MTKKNPRIWRPPLVFITITTSTVTKIISAAIFLINKTVYSHKWSSSKDNNNNTMYYVRCAHDPIFVRRGKEAPTPLPKINKCIWIKKTLCLLNVLFSLIKYLHRMKQKLTEKKIYTIDFVLTWFICDGVTISVIYAMWGPTYEPSVSF